ncbi:MAG: hypothetical protein HUU56_00050 [Bdellovibrionaceae bacterium]|nr:hypothetical protein [Pseudobdellovibrionaceae bacterium]
MVVKIISKEQTPIIKSHLLLYQRSLYLTPTLRFAPLPVTPTELQKYELWFASPLAKFDLVAAFREKEKSHWTMKEKINFLNLVLKDLLQELTIMAKLRLAHNEIKPGNILVSADGHFGLSDFDAVTSWLHKTRFFSSNYVAFESLNPIGSDPLSDIYSLAVTLAQLMFSDNLDHVMMTLDNPKLVKFFQGQQRISLVDVRLSFKEIESKLLSLEDSELKQKFSLLKRFIIAGIEEDYHQRRAQIRLLKNKELEFILSEIEKEELKLGPLNPYSDKDIWIKKKKTDTELEIDRLIGKLAQGIDLKKVTEHLQERELSAKHHIKLLLLQKINNTRTKQEVRLCASELLLKEKIVNFRSILIFSEGLKAASSSDDRKLLENKVALLLQYYHPTPKEWSYLKNQLNDFKLFEILQGLLQTPQHSSAKIKQDSILKIKKLYCYRNYL